jgi:hypothetical protein
VLFISDLVYVPSFFLIMFSPFIFPQSGSTIRCHHCTYPNGYPDSAYARLHGRLSSVHPASPSLAGPHYTINIFIYIYLKFTPAQQQPTMLGPPDIRLRTTTPEPQLAVAS